MVFVLNKLKYFFEFEKIFFKWLCYYGKYSIHIEYAGRTVLAHHHHNIQLLDIIVRENLSLRFSLKNTLTYSMFFSKTRMCHRMCV